MVWLRLPFDGDFAITQNYGEHPEVYNSQGYAGHPGIDYGLPTGTPVLAAAAGVVTKTGTDPVYWGRGIHVWIKHDDRYSTVYMHLESFAVSEGQQVAAGQLIGHSDNTGLTDGPHLHLGLHDAEQQDNGYAGFVDPAPFIGTGTPPDPVVSASGIDAATIGAAMLIAGMFAAVVRLADAAVANVKG